MNLTPEEDLELEKLESKFAKDGCTQIELDRLQQLLDKYYDQTRS